MAVSHQGPVEVVCGNPHEEQRDGEGHHKGRAHQHLGEGGVEESMVLRYLRKLFFLCFSWLTINP